ncbi:kelch-like protein 10 [Clarias gariepinus]
MAKNVFNEMRLAKELCDVLLKVDGAEFHAHKIILCDCSPYFRILFTNRCYPPDKHQYTIPGVSSQIMELILEYAYVQWVNITEENVYELLIAADYLAISSLVNSCSVFLKAQLCLENSIGIWRFACFYSCKNLEQRAFQFILHNFEKVLCVSEEFLKLKADELCEILENNNLNVREEEVVFDAIMLWIKHAPLDRKTHIALLLSKLRMGLLKQEYLLNKVRKNYLVTDDRECRSIIFRALVDKYRLNPDEFNSDLARPRLPRPLC